MYSKRRRPFFIFPFIIIMAILLLGLVVMLLWNFIFPTVLHTSGITYWQAIALLILCRILFVGFNRRRNNGRPNIWRDNPKWREKWKNMSDEERAKFREEWKRRCGRPYKNE
jgi:hypothetical protein